MSGLKKNETERTDTHARPDLDREYRPIGISAVAAALSVTGEKKPQENRPDDAGNSDAGNSNEHNRYWDSIAA